ncbi:MAG: polyprenol monophosphomannose synthase [Methanomicrobiales archaeon]|nr:polyprenol monophosphomannose synthase [Methanomicrobiales archaeon]
MYDCTIIIPTLNEEMAIPHLILELIIELQTHNIHGEILVIDDNSKDNTIRCIDDIRKSNTNVRYIVRRENPGLSQSVVEGFYKSDSLIFIVMDADFSHPPSFVPHLYYAIREGNDIAIASRYIRGGGIAQWPLKRRVLSMGATTIARFIVPCVKDPVSGFFAVHYSVIEGIRLKPRGYKILLEILGRGNWNKIKEIPFTFCDRRDGTSKLRILTLIDYLAQIGNIFFFRFVQTFK